VLRTGARWSDLPSEYPPYQTCHRRFQEWQRNGILKKILESIAQKLLNDGVLKLDEASIDGSFTPEKKWGVKLENLKKEKALKSWQLLRVMVFLLEYPLKVLHHMKLRLLKEQFNRSLHLDYQIDLSETKHMILMTLTRKYLKNMG
jgi:hypothetical protein